MSKKGKTVKGLGELKVALVEVKLDEQDELADLLASVMQECKTPAMEAQEKATTFAKEAFAIYGEAAPFGKRAVAARKAAADLDAEIGRCQREKSRLEWEVGRIIALTPQLRDSPPEYREEVRGKMLEKTVAPVIASSVPCRRNCRRNWQRQRSHGGRTSG